MASHLAQQHRFSLSITDINMDTRVTGFTGQARLSGLFHYDIRIASKQATADLETWLGQPATLTLHGHPDRYIHGIISEAAVGGSSLAAVSDQRFTDYRITIVPRLWRLSQSKNHRLFQHKNANQIIALVLAHHGIQGDELQDETAAGPTRPYCVQYGETDLAFFNRLMAEEGWHYHHRHNADRHVLVLADANAAFRSIDGASTLRFAPDTSRPQDTACIHSLAFRQERATGAVRLGDFNFLKPGSPLTGTAGTDPGLEHYQFPAGLEHRPSTNTLAQLRLEQDRSRSAVFHMQTHAIHCESGRQFPLQLHPNPAFNVPYVVLAESCIASQPQALEEAALAEPARFLAQLECQTAAQTVRAPFDHPKPTVKGPVTAVVTGPPGEEIYTDAHGRVKVQFFWDRAGQADEHSSAWLRVSQPVAGVQWGGMLLPRVGQEVIVEFEHGDPDRPLITGRLYNGQSPSPGTLPAQQSRSQLTTLSSPGGGGYHAIRIDDRKGAEQMQIRAEKDLDLRVKRQRRTDIAGHQHRRVARQDAREIQQDLHESVSGSVQEQIGQSVSLTVGKDLHLSVRGARIVQAGGSIHIKAGAKAFLHGGLSLSIKGGAGFINLDATGVSIGGPLVRINEGGGSGSASSANPVRPGQPAEADNGIPGSRLHQAALPITPLPELIRFDRTQLASLQQAQRLQAPLVEPCEDCLLTSTPQPESAKDAPVDSTHRFSVRIETPDGQPVAHKKFLLDTGGEQISGMTDATGLIDTPLQAALTQGSLHVWPTESGEPLSVPFLHPPLLDDVSTVKGQQARLLNLGYPTGALDGINGPKTRAAITRFQQDQQLTADGICGPVTQARLQQVYGQ